MQTHQDAFAVPFQHRGVHLGVAQPLGDRGETHVEACLGGQETAASSSLLSDEVTTNGGLQNDRSRWRKCGGRNVAWSATGVGRQQAALSVRGWAKT